MHFEWDPRKAIANQRKHRVSFEEAASVFDDRHAQTQFDAGHAEVEDRYVTMGLSAVGRVLIVVHTDRDRAIRIITARRATPMEMRIYVGRRATT